MQAIRVPIILRERLGEQASEALAEMTHQTAVAAIDEALDRATERFERRLAEGIAGLRIDMADLRVELLKWSFVFWTGQVVAIAALLALIR